ncbi:hypothetical protein GpartN1_g7688.t1 [Galdieria partita]|uniref:Cell division control protein n=1 Tax=Galdieria partita TaxID=83374 RepID=A0A9C7Q878_9RHOD|nr:hypothetical protein GpartN1_g7688.t1 [Galdieria partita]
MVATRSSKRLSNDMIHNDETKQMHLTTYVKTIKRPRTIVSNKEDSHCCLDQVKLSESLLAASQYFSLSYEPSRCQVIGREQTICTISEMLRNWVNHQDMMSLYLCGSPGTGKSLCVKAALEMIATSNTKYGLQNIHTIYVNCATISDPKTIYSVITSQMEETHAVPLHSNDTRTTHWIRTMQNIKTKQHILLVLEELDFLVTRDMSVLYSLLECPFLVPNVGILATANSVDLPERTASRLKLYCAQPLTIPLSPYSCDEMENILYQRLCLAKANYPCLERIPISHFTNVFQLVASKIAASFGDIRLALDVIRTLFLSTAKKISSEYQGHNCFLLQDAARILEEKGGLASMKHRIMNLPLQQQLVVLACVVLSNRKSLFTLTELYSQLTQLSRQLELPTISFSQFVDICENSLSDHGIIQLDGKRLDKRRLRCSLLTCVNEIKAALEQFTLYASWL